MKMMTVQDLTKEMLKQMDAGNGNRLVMVSNDVRFPTYHPLLLNLATEKDEILSKVNTQNPKSMILIG